MCEVLVSSAKFQSVQSALRFFSCDAGRFRKLSQTTADPGRPGNVERDEWVRSADYLAMLATVAERSDDPAFAARIGLGYHLRQSRHVGFLTMHQPTVRDAFRVFAQNAHHLVRGARFVLSEVGSVATFRYETQASPEVARHDVELTLAAVVASLRAHLPAVEIRAVTFMHQHRGGQALSDLLGVTTTFGCHMNAVVFPASVLDCAFPGADPHLRRSIERLMHLAGIAPWGDTLAAQVANVLTHATSPEDLEIAAVAKALCMTPRTLQRRLASENLSFSTLREDARQKKAITLLIHSDIPISEISHRVGFSDISSFYRSFRQWTGAAPAAFREGHRLALTPAASSDGQLRALAR